MNDQSFELLNILDEKLGRIASALEAMNGQSSKPQTRHQLIVTQLTPTDWSASIMQPNGEGDSGHGNSVQWAIGEAVRLAYSRGPVYITEITITRR